VRRFEKKDTSMRSPIWFLTSIKLEIGKFDMDPRLETAILGALEMAIADGRQRWSRAEAEVAGLKEKYREVNDG
jgi:hypothetical protein